LKDNPSRNSTITVIVMCAIVFLAFTFCYVFFYQAESLAYLQHSLSQGMTTYNRTIGAVIITLLAVLLQYAVFRISGLRKRGHALTYFPSILALTVLTDVRPCGDVSHFWIWLAPVLLLV
jgi:protein-S-isoprenylcysteine O-methyltransferase Ste14